jgi:hypothetical protein
MHICMFYIWTFIIIYVITKIMVNKIIGGPRKVLEGVPLSNFFSITYNTQFYRRNNLNRKIKCHNIVAHQICLKIIETSIQIVGKFNSAT